MTHLMIFVRLRLWWSRPGGKAILVEDRAEIRRLHRAEQLPVRAIARHLGISREDGGAREGGGSLWVAVRPGKGQKGL